MHLTRVKNPILRGFNPDPNIVKAGDTYYIVVSSFEWLPGVRVYESKDLVNWTFKTDILTDQVSLQGNPANGSIWAPQISYADGLFYLIYTDVKSVDRPFKDTHNYMITAETIEGPWSEPIYLNSSGFDPSLFHDSNGKKWLLNEIWDYRKETPNKSAGIVMQEFDPTQNQLVGPIRKIFDGTPLAKTEAPHLYYHGGYYYLITAEGGTGTGHSVTVCRSKEVTGPYELDPEYPMLTASDKPDSPLQCSGHGSIVQSPFGQWYMVYLCTRPLNGQAILGRETAIQEVYWTEDGWLRLKDEGNGPSQYAEIAVSKETKQESNSDFYEDFNEKLCAGWNARRILPDDTWCDLSSRPGHLRLLSGESLQSVFEHHLLAVRQTDFHFEAQTALEYEPSNYNQMAGLVLYLNEKNYIYCYVTYEEEIGKCLRIIKAEEGTVTLEKDILPLKEEKTYLKVEADGPTGKFFVREDERHPWQQIGDPQNLLVLAGGFTGNFVGIAVHDLMKKGGSYADFDFFLYHGYDR
jgi:xylan 1,4-beta-xylosidase